MKNLFKKLVIFSIIFLPFYTAFFIVVDYFVNIKKPVDEIFVWGDSQISQAIDFDMLSNKTGKTVYSAAYHASDAYDFLVFTNKVPENSNIILGITYDMLLRDWEKEYNRSGFSIHALKDVYDYNYPIMEIFNIIKYNIGIKRLYQNFTLQYESADTSDLSKLETFKKTFNNTPDYLDIKLKLFEKGFKQLMDKNCVLTFINLPFHSSLDSILNNSISIKRINEFKTDLLNAYSFETNNKTLNCNGSFLHDVAHLNDKGRTLVTEDLIVSLPHISVNTYISYHFNESSSLLNLP